MIKRPVKDQILSTSFKGEILMGDSQNSDYKIRGLEKLNKKKVLKIVSMGVVALLIIMTLHQILLNISAPSMMNPPPPPQEARANTGYEDYYHYAGGMVNTANGNLFLTQKDISIKARGFHIEIIRAYNTQERTSAYPQDYFGIGWTCNYFIYLQTDRITRNVTLTEGDGSVFEYGYIGYNNFTTPDGKHGRLNRNIGGSLTIRYLDGSSYNFDSSGKLQNISDKNGNKIKLTYTSGKLTKVEEDSGVAGAGGGSQTIYLNISYNGNLISNITDSMGRKITYSYTNYKLMNVTDAMGNLTQYTYNNYNRLESVTNRVKHRLNFTYELNATTLTYRVKTIYNSMWNSTSQLPYDSFKMYEFTYNVNEGSSDPLNETYFITNVTDARGYTTRVYVNDYGNPLKIEDPTGNTTKHKWDNDLNKIEFTDKNNNTYTFSYYYHTGDLLKTYGILNKATDPTNNYTEYGYEIKDNTDEYVALLRNVTNKRGYTTIYTYDSNYNLLNITDARGNTSYRTYDTFGNMISYKDFRGSTWNYTYDLHQNLLNVTDPGGNISKYRYDSANRLKNVTNARGYKTSYEYDDNDRITKIIDALGNSTTYTYDAGNEGGYTTGMDGDCGGTPSIGCQTPISVVDENGLQTNYTLNRSVKRIQKIEQSPGCGCSEKNFKYDKIGNLIEFEDVNGNKTTYAYDGLNRLINETDARGNSTTYIYDANGNMKSVTNRRGYTTSYNYDSLNRNTKVTDALGNYTEYTYDAEGNQKTVKNQRGYTTTYYYDELNRLIKINDALNHNTTYTYDENSNKKTEVDANGNTNTFYYDASNLLLKVKDPLNQETKYDYDSMGNILNITDANGNKTKYTYDALNRLISVSDANNNVTYCSYDAAGHLLNITDANNHKTRQEYDSLGRLKKIIYPSGNETEYSYDNVGNLIAREDAKGLSTLYDYDELNRLEKVTYPDGSTIDYEYNEGGNPTKITTNASFGETTYYTYDALDRVISVRVDYGTFDKYVNYTFDEIGNRKTMINPEGNTTYYTYDALDRLINITAPGHNPILFQYDNGGRRTRLDYPNGAYTTYSYDNTDMITTIWHKKSNGSTIAVYNYTYDNIDNILNFTENDVNYTLYTYDNIYRLTNISYPDGNWTNFTYDNVGNRLTLKNSTATITYNYDEDNRILTIGNINYKHDKNGNLINKTDGNSTMLYEYDYNNRLTKVTLPNSGTVNYQYSAYGRKLNRSSSSSTHYFYDEKNNLLEMDKNGSTIAYYVYGPNINELIFMVRNGSSYYYHTDIFGNMRLLTDVNKEVVTSYNYDAFGNIINGIEKLGVNNSYKFDSRELDDKTQMYNYQSKYYDADMGRFIQKNRPWPLYGKAPYSNMEGYQPDNIMVYIYEGWTCNKRTSPSGTEIGWTSVGITWQGEDVNVNVGMGDEQMVPVMYENPGLNRAYININLQYSVSGGTTERGVTVKYDFIITPPSIYWTNPDKQNIDTFYFETYIPAGTGSIGHYYWDEYINCWMKSPYNKGPDDIEPEKDYRTFKTSMTVRAIPDNWPFTDTGSDGGSFTLYPGAGLPSNWAYYPIEIFI